MIPLQFIMHVLQNIEFKVSWRDEYEIICGFAKANGGKIFFDADDNSR
jgi:predicted HTH transcriptional regulator